MKFDSKEILHKSLKKLKHPAVKWGLIFSATTILISIIGFYLILLGGKMVVDEKGFVLSEATVIETVDGVEVATLYSENRTFVSIDQIPKHVQDAFIAIEDKRFYDHAGVDFFSVLRALYKDIIAFDKVEGASTITQQLVKNIYLTNDKAWLRKTQEVMGAIYLEREFSKEKILEYYLNEIYFGHGVYGIEKAAQFYFGKSVQNLTVSEGALLAGLPKAPSNYSPIDYPEKAIQRRNIVLSSMQQLNMINAEEMVALQGRTMGLQQGEPKNRPWIETYVDLVLKEAEERHHISRNEIYRGGYKIVTGINPVVQQAAYEAFQDDQYFTGTGEGQEGAFVLLDAKTGTIVAAIGGRQFQRGDLNRVFVNRQPGSVMKPLAVYGPALEMEKYSPYSMLKDEQMTYNGGYIPKNYDNQYLGEVSMYEALQKSKNAPAVWLLNEISLDYSKEYLSQMGINLPDENLALALGGLSEGVTPLQMAKAYRSFIHDGKVTDPYAILHIEDRKGNVIATSEAVDTKVFSSQTAWNMTKMLKAVVEQGTGTAGDYNKELAGKTGSTEHPTLVNRMKDVWFVGYTPEYVGAVWLGYDKTDEEHYLTEGSSVPTALFKQILSEVDNQVELAAAFQKPNNVEDLPEPITLPVIQDLTAEKSFGFLSGVRATLQWSVATDERIIYRIYEKTSDGSRLIAEVKGKSRYEDKEASIFDEKTYYVVPFNPLTGQVGQKSNEASTD
ncbi:penicillin-binding protein 2A [Salirhabdus euzebyi]|uniref:Penicillin-binding protein 2A n=1 Tax=Salirhabdus euzebyi TaxID=394506 RepID=A0A841Q8A4_9BACI|nr:PBP1A family penicillin-binding protein [Salirhabdus euzebyi]MBB6454691.1 penicillin-binding protein 2A [Salirhabdus euzebyi]